MANMFGARHAVLDALMLLERGSVVTWFLTYELLEGDLRNIGLMLGGVRMYQTSRFVAPKSFRKYILQSF